MQVVVHASDQILRPHRMALEAVASHQAHTHAHALAHATRAQKREAGERPHVVPTQRTAFARSNRAPQSLAQMDSREGLRGPHQPVIVHVIR